MIKNIPVFSLTKEKANRLYQKGVTNFESNDQYLQALGFFQQSVGGKILHEKYHVHLTIKDITTDQLGNLRFVDVDLQPQLYQMNNQIDRFVGRVSQDDTPSYPEFD